MIATISPAGCGGRHRHLAASLLFAAGAVGAAALLGAAAGAAGSLAGARPTAALALAVALLGALRETALRSLPLPQLRLQVPERWRRELPLGVWPAGYGVGLGVGLLTFQPVATLWVALAAAASLGDPRRAALCLAPFGAARAALATLPGLRAETAERALIRHTRLMRRVNAVTLALVAMALAAAPAVAAPLPLGPGSQLDPATSAGALAFTERDGAGASVVIVRPGQPPVAVEHASSPSLDGPLLALQDASGVRVLRWADGSQVTRVHGARRPALRHGWLAYLRRRAGGQELLVRRLDGSGRRVIARVRRGTLSRPTLRDGRVAWVVSGREGSSLRSARLDGGGRRVLVRSRIDLLGDPALGSRWIAYTRTSRDGAVLLARRLGRTGTRTLLALRGGRAALASTALVGRTAYVTRWSTKSGAARILRLRF